MTSPTGPTPGHTRFERIRLALEAMNIF